MRSTTNSDVTEDNDVTRYTYSTYLIPVHVVFEVRERPASRAFASLQRGHGRAESEETDMQVTT